MERQAQWEPRDSQGGMVLKGYEAFQALRENKG